MMSTSFAIQVVFPDKTAVITPQMNFAVCKYLPLYFFSYQVRVTKETRVVEILEDH